MTYTCLRFKLKYNRVITARKRSLQRLCLYRCVSFILFTGGGMCGFIWEGACMVFSGGACMVLFGGHAWFYLGGLGGWGWHAWFYLGGHAWFYSGGMHGFIWGGMCGFIWVGVRGFIRGACVVLFGGACVVLFGGHAWFYSGGGVCVFFSFFGYNEIRSMSGRYASYWNAFLLWIRLLQPKYFVCVLVYYLISYLFQDWAALLPENRWTWIGHDPRWLVLLSDPADHPDWRPRTRTYGSTGDSHCVSSQGFFVWYLGSSRAVNI